MRGFSLSAALLCLAVSSPAQEKGALTLDTTVAVTSNGGLGVGYNLTDRLSLRPTLAGGYSSLEGVFFTLATDVRFEITPRRRLTPFATAGAAYVHDRSELVDMGPQPVRIHDPHMLQMGVGLGLRWRLTDRFFIFAEERFVHSAFDDLAGSGLEGRFPSESRNWFEPRFGLSFRLK